MTPEQDHMLRAVFSAVFADRAPGELGRQIWATRIVDLPTEGGSGAEMMRGIGRQVWAERIDNLPTEEGAAADMIRDIHGKP